MHSLSEGGESGPRKVELGSNAIGRGLHDHVS
jgi:hypothetical protein